MNSLVNGWRRAALAALVLALPVAAACSDALGSSEDEQNDAQIEILFPTMYSAWDGVHEFRVPAKVEGVKNVKWSADPADAVDIEKDGDDGVLITVKKPVDVVTIHAKAGSLKSSAKLHVTEATPEEWEEGNERYNNGVVWSRGGRDGGGGGRGDGGGGGKKGERRVDPNLACTNCHNKGGKGGDVEHTPMQTGGFSDEELVMIFSEGKKPDGVKMRTTTKERWQKMHQWEMEPEEKKGLIVYLRSLEPEPQGEVDFGGRGGGGGKGKGKGKGKGNRDEGDERPSGPQEDAGSDPQ